MVNHIVDFMSDMDNLSFRLKCTTQSLHLLHSSMENDNGTNFEMHCNAILSVLRQLYQIQEEQDTAVSKVYADYRSEHEVIDTLLKLTPADQHRVHDIAKHLLNAEQEAAV